MAQLGRPKKYAESFSTIRVRTTQRKMLSAMRLDESEPLHHVLFRVLRDFLGKRPELKAHVKQRMDEDARRGQSSGETAHN